MEKVTGIGGIFFKARHPGRLGDWYQKHLGLEIKDGCADFHWRAADRPEQKGRTVWSAFPSDSDYFPSQAMINYRVENLDRMLAQLRQAGIAIEKTETFDYGRFAWLTDPEGNRIELWEAKTQECRRPA
jgi:predicted enzyme related to lactoylglutathione lyase